MLYFFSHYCFLNDTFYVIRRVFYLKFIIFLVIFLFVLFRREQNDLILHLRLFLYSYRNISIFLDPDLFQLFLLLISPVGGYLHFFISDFLLLLVLWGRKGLASLFVELLVLILFRLFSEGGFENARELGFGGGFGALSLFLENLLAFLLSLSHCPLDIFHAVHALTYDSLQTLKTY